MEILTALFLAMLTALGPVFAAFFGWLARRGVEYLDRKTTLLDEASEIQRKEALKNRIVEAVTLAARATTQTFVDAAKARNEDGKLTKAEAAEALKLTVERAGTILRDDGIQVGREVLEVVVEAVVGKLKLEKPIPFPEAKAA